VLKPLIKKAYNPPAAKYSDIGRTIEQISRHYYWPNMRYAVGRYIRNCHSCQISKAPRNRKNGLLRSLPIPQQRWQNISMDFIIGLSDSEGKNAICIIINRLTKERHYVACITKEEGTIAEAISEILLKEIIRLYGLLLFIVSNREFQFIALV